jgi:threonylcarbamoyladenosine tRNA methylthiotransferase MtaB
MGNLNNCVALETLGCKLNQAESESLINRFAERGYSITPHSNCASVYILNTCTVTHVADRKCRHLLRLARRLNSHALIIAIGCYAERAADDLYGVAGVDMVIGNEEKLQLPDILMKQGRLNVGSALSPRMHRTRSLVKVQEGCNQFCSYCVVPMVRGRERSLPADEVVSEVRTRVERGYREVVLTGTQIGSYRNGVEFLIQRILDETEIKRLRLSSLQPPDITKELLSLWQKYPKILCRHIHLPLQSGSDVVLQRMGRQYSTEIYKQAVARVREAIPDVAITTDIIVGFPGETDGDFAQSYQFSQRMAFANIHVFPYSTRSGTHASQMPERVDEQVKKQRSRQMLMLAKQSAHNFREQFIGRTMLVLWERESNESTWEGLTDNYIRVVARSNEPLQNRLIPALLGSEHNSSLRASISP